MKRFPSMPAGLLLLASLPAPAQEDAARRHERLIEHLKKDFGLDKSDTLMTAQSLYHDHACANAFGIASAWIDRRHALEGYGATMAPADRPHIDFHFKSLRELAEAHRAELTA